MKIIGRILTCDLEDDTITFQLRENFFKDHKICAGYADIITESIEPSGEGNLPPVQNQRKV